MIAFTMPLTLGCQPAATPHHLKNTGEGPGATLLPAGTKTAAAAGQTLYVPIYAYIYINDNAKPFNLAATLYVRNTDRAKSIVIESVKYQGASGKLIKSFLKGPIRLDPLASSSFFVPESETSGGSSTSFLVDWVAAEPANPAIAEAVMVGTLMNQGVTLRSEGRVIADLSKP